MFSQLAIALGASISLFAGQQTPPAQFLTTSSFRRPPYAVPVIKPDPRSMFDCPMRGGLVHWQATHTFNPAAVVKDGKVWVLFRAEDNIGAGIGGFTSRLGLASSKDGVHFTKEGQPVLYPAKDDQKAHEWEGGCEDPRCVETEDGTFVVFYTQYERHDGLANTDLGMATSKDLHHWKKLGPVKGMAADGTVVVPSKSASLVTAVRGGKVVAVKIHGKYWLYYGDSTIRLLSSPDLKSWTPVPGFALEPRAGKFDSELAECGPPALVTSQGIVLLYNGKNSPGPTADSSLPRGVYASGEAIMDANDPSKVLARTDKPFFKPELPWEKTGQYKDGTTFIEGLVLFHHKWLLYYGCADQFVGVAVGKEASLR